MSKSMTRQAFLGVFAALFAVLMALAMAPNAAFADDLVVGQSEVGQNEDPYFTVYVQEQTGVDDAGKPVYGEKKVATTFSQAQFEGLKEASPESLAYVYNDGTKAEGALPQSYVAYGTKDYVTLAKIIAQLPANYKDAWTFDGAITVGNTKYNSGQLMTGTNPDDIGTYVLEFGKDKNDKTKLVEANTKGDGTNEDVIPPVFALSYGTSSAFNGPADVNESGTVNTGALANKKNEALNAAAVSTDAPLFLHGKESKKNAIANSAIPTKVNSITLHKPIKGAFTVRVSVNGKTKLAKWFSANDLKELAKKNTDTKYYLFNTTIVKAESYITLDQILEAANVSFMLDDSLGFDCYDGPWKKSQNMTPDLIKSGQFFPAYAFGESYDSSGAESVPAVFALKWASPKKTETNSSASDYATGKVSLTAKDEVYPRFCVGTATETFLASGPRPGSDFPSGINTLTVNIVTNDLSKATVTVADQANTGSAITPDVIVSMGTTKLVKDRDYTVAFSDNVGPGTAKVTITPKDADHFSGKATATFQIKKTADQLAADLAAASNINTKKVTAAQIQAAAALGATSVTFGKNVKSIEPGAFKGTGITSITLNTAKLTKKGVKGSLTGSNVKTIKVQAKKIKSLKGLSGKAKKKVQKQNKKAKAYNKKLIAKYKKFFTKKNCGRNVKFKL